MPKLTEATPKYSKHRASGQAVVKLDGRLYYLGPHGTKTSHGEYDRLVAEWLANGRQMPAQTDGNESVSITVAELIAAYVRHCKAYYRKNGMVTAEVAGVKYALAFLRRLYGREMAEDFGPLKLKAVRQAMISHGLTRRSINQQVGRIRRMFRWGLSEEQISATPLVLALDKLTGLKIGRTEAAEAAPVKPVDDETVDATLPYLSDTVADMVRLQRFTGARPTEVCTLRPMDLDRTGDVWLYRPESHKTEHHGRERVICIGPKAQEILGPYLLRADGAHCFDPRDTVRKQLAEKYANRTTPLSCGNKPGTNRKTSPKRRAGSRYTNDSYRRAVHRAVDAANRARETEGIARLDRWSPNRLRHSAATEIRKRFGLEAAQVCLGHAAADITQLYAERDLQKAAEVMREVG